jgi:nucleoside diphosphate kinase
MENKNFEYTGWKINGFVALVLILAAIAAGVVMIVKGENASARVREIVGATDSRKALHNTIRGMYGTDACMNVIHASDSEENALLEINRFYKLEKEDDITNGYSYSKRRD